MGLQQLYGGQPLAAFDSLLEVVQVFHGNPRLWLRLAEACIASHAKVRRSGGREGGRKEGRERRVGRDPTLCKRSISLMTDIVVLIPQYIISVIGSSRPDSSDEK